MSIGLMVKENKTTFFARLEPCLSPSELRMVKGAYYIAKFGHRAQKRTEKDENGNALRYFEHLRRVAIILIDEASVYDPDLICTALLHDSLEDTNDIDADIIEQFFGSIVARRVKLLTKKPKDGYIKRLECADNLTILVKACDRLDNLRSLRDCHDDFIRKQIIETREKYLPLFISKIGNHIIIPKIRLEMAQHSF